MKLTGISHMQSGQGKYNSYLLRVWQEEKSGKVEAWHFELESIQTDQRWQFKDLQALFNYLHDQVEGNPINPSDSHYTNPNVSKED